MVVICAWCKLPLREKPPLDSNAATHTICLDCADVHFPGMLRSLEIQGLCPEAPALTVAADGAIVEG